MMEDRTVTIGGATGAWGDSMFGAEQLLASKRCDYIVFEALAEITMAILARARMKNPKAGYATDIIEMIGRDIRACREQGVRIISNAGGVNPAGAAARLAELAAMAGVDLKIATVHGDDLLDRLDLLGELPGSPLSANVYLGAQPIAAALGAGADVVITGRCVDSALALGPLVHEFGWATSDLDRLAQGSLAGHLIECGPQATGGLMTDWHELESFEDIGYPIAECRADGSFVFTKPDGTGGLVDERTVAEQLVYEIGDPSAYLLPDVTCDWREVRLTQDGRDRVRVEGARGRPPPGTLKVCVQIPDGFKVKVTLLVAGIDAVRKAERLGADVLRRADRVLNRLGAAPLCGSDIEVLGAESTYGPHSRAREAREVVLKLGLHHRDRAVLSAVVREIPSFGLATVGISAGGGGLARVTPLLRLHNRFVPRGELAPIVRIENERVAYADPAVAVRDSAPPEQADVPREFEVVDGVEVALACIAHGRSGDKGAHANIGVRARTADFWPLLCAQLTASRVAAYLAHLIDGSVSRYELPGIHALNFVLTDALGGGGIASLRYDAQGKAYAQQLLSMPVEVPRGWTAHPRFKRVGF